LEFGLWDLILVFLPDKCESLKKVRKILSIVLLSLLGIIIL